MNRGTQPRQKKRIAEWWHWIYLEKVTMSTIYAGKQLLPCGWPNDYWIISRSLHYDANDSETDSRPGVLRAVSVFCWVHSNTLCCYNHFHVDEHFFKKYGCRKLLKVSNFVYYYFSQHIIIWTSNSNLLSYWGIWYWWLINRCLKMSRYNLKHLLSRLIWLLVGISHQGTLGETYVV